MATRHPTFFLSLPNKLRQPICIQCRSLHENVTPRTPIPSPTPFVPDAQTFLTLIGRKMSQHAAKIPSWEALFTLSSQQLRDSGVEPARARRYLLWWRERYRNGLMGIGGDLQQVQDGVAELKVVEVVSDRPYDQQATLTKDPGVRKMIINPPLDVTSPSDAANPGTVKASKDLGLVPPPRIEPSQATPVAGVKILRGATIAGRGVEYVKGRPSVARLRVQDGLWEVRRGHKVDGGERRKAEVRAKRRAAERKNAR